MPVALVLNVPEKEIFIRVFRDRWQAYPVDPQIISFLTELPREMTEGRDSWEPADTDSWDYWSPWEPNDEEETVAIELTLQQWEWVEEARRYSGYTYGTWVGFQGFAEKVKDIELPLRAEAA